MFFESFLLNLAVIVILILALIFDYVTKFFSYWYVRHIPYKYPVPFFGSDYHRVLGIRGATDEVNTLYHQHPHAKFVGSIRSRIPDLIVKDAGIINLMFSKESEYFNSRGLCLERSQDVCLRNNLFYAEGEKWNLLKENLESILKSKSRNFEQNERSADKYLGDVDGEINVQNFLEIIMDGVIKDLLFGEDFSFDEAEVVLNLRSELRRITLFDKFKSYLKNIFPSIYILLGLNTLKSQSDRKVQKVMKDADLTKEASRYNFALSKGKGESEIDIAFSLLSLFITEGYVPCLNTITCVLYELSKVQVIQQKLRCNEGAQSEDDLWLNIIKETMRLYPSYSTITRKCTKTFKFAENEGNLLIDRGVTLTMPVEALHRDQKYFEDSGVFKPERFCEEAEAKIPACAYLPFGVGPRKCIGENLSLRIIRAVAASILKKYKIQVSEKTPQKLSFRDHNFVRELNNKVWLQFTPINAVS